MSSPSASETKPSAEERAEDLIRAAEAQGRRAKWGMFTWIYNLRFLAFGVYLILAVITFWLWVFTTVLWFIRTVLHLVASILAWIGGGGWHQVRGRNPVQVFGAWFRRFWSDRMSHYRSAARPVARGIVTVRDGMVTFWKWGPAHKIAAVLATFFLVVIPGTYIVPRPHYVQIIDDNVIEHHNPPNGTIRYLIHAVDLHKPSRKYEYQNERAVWLAKIDPQGIKNELVPGRFYRLSVIGIRWQFLPTLFPNIISVTEVDRQGNPLPEPSGLIPSPDDVGDPRRGGVGP